MTKKLSQVPLTYSTPPEGGLKPEASKVARSPRCAGEATAEKTCLDCGCTFTVFGADEVKKRMFCSRSCAGRNSRRGVYIIQVFRDCLECQKTFLCKDTTQRKERKFCTASCAMKRRCRLTPMSQEQRAKNAATMSRIMKEVMKPGGVRARASSERMVKNNPMKREEIRTKVSLTHKASGHKPPQGGNGRPAPEPQIALFQVLAGRWEMEFVVNTKKRREGFPNCYKIDIAHPEKKIAIEVDGESHNCLKTQVADMKKTKFLESVGWTVLRFGNREILNWRDSGMKTESSISTTLRSMGIRHTRSKAS